MQTIPKEKGALLRAHNDANHGSNYTTGLSIRLWRIAYQLEELRQDHAAAGHLWRQAGCCVALSLFRLIGGLV